MKNTLIKLVFTLVIVFASTASQSEQHITTSVDRAWGLLLGDEITVTVNFSDDVAELDSNALPQTERRYAAWLYLKQVEVINRSALFHYQVVNVPNKTTYITTPVFEVSDVNGKVISIPEVQLSIGPLLVLADGQRSSTVELKADHAPILIKDSVLKERLKSLIISFILMAIVLAVWNFGWRPKHRQPFAQAVHELSRLRWQRAKKSDQAARIVHKAFNQTTGTIVVYQDLEQLFASKPWLLPLQLDIKDFYQHSATYFFSPQAGKEQDYASLLKLAKACRSKEKLA
ncbi:hypothetical protein A9Q78_06395 [Methylophaga sp. 41_12_T18]|nr:hypothetical protein A9Q78_06395 [Methylophaga sp. 41_12_T18]